MFTGLLVLQLSVFLLFTIPETTVKIVLRSDGTGDNISMNEFHFLLNKAEPCCNEQSQSNGSL